MGRSPSLVSGFPERHRHYGTVRPLTAPRFGFPLPRYTAPTHLTGPNPASVRHDQVSPGHVALRPTMPTALTTDPSWSPLGTPSSRLCRVGAPGVRDDRFAGLIGLGCGLVVCLRSFGLRLATDTLPFSAIARTQMGEQVSHLLENTTAGHTESKAGVRA
jgi:hypothetical protein